MIKSKDIIETESINGIVYVEAEYKLTQTKKRYLQQLRKRVRCLEKRISESTYPLTYDIVEKNAINWALSIINPKSEKE